MKIAVCGCSFSSPVGGEYAGRHWSELLAKELDAEIIHFARQGISNNAIRLQIDEAIKHKPDYVIINATTEDRIEVPLDPSNNKKQEKYVGFCGVYDPDLGLKNLNYPDHKPTMISETIFSIIDWPKHPYRKTPINQDSKMATKLYAAFLYDSAWKTQCDYWVLTSGLWKLHEHKIDFLFNPWILNEEIWNKDLPNWFVKKYFVGHQVNLLEMMGKYKPRKDPGYHTTDKGQEFIKDEYIKFINSQRST